VGPLLPEAQLYLWPKESFSSSPANGQAQPKLDHPNIWLGRQLLCTHVRSVRKEGLFSLYRLVKKLDRYDARSSDDVSIK
jgi:hypothetical protein